MVFLNILRKGDKMKKRIIERKTLIKIERMRYGENGEWKMERI